MTAAGVVAVAVEQEDDNRLASSVSRGASKSLLFASIAGGSKKQEEVRSKPTDGVLQISKYEVEASRPLPLTDVPASVEGESIRVMDILRGVGRVEDSELVEE